ncbi:Ribophorin I [Dipodascopsis tothii]|uniref:Ribophorin I n=1 Tax=Dipodascopsis tothii TaxID=44089 RepID=UPI0034CDF419
MRAGAGLVLAAAGWLSALGASAEFVPPPTFEITNLLRTLDLSKAYVRQSTSMNVMNVGSFPTDEFYIAFPGDVVNSTVDHVAILEAKTKTSDGALLAHSKAEFDSERNVQYYKITLDAPVKPRKSVSLQFASAVTDTLQAQPRTIKQADPQYLQYEGSTVELSPYFVAKQRTIVKYGNRYLASYTRPSEADPVTESGTLTYGPYENTPAFKVEPLAVRYDYTMPVIKGDRLERDVWVSHYGGNVAVEERYWIHNAGARMTEAFSRLKWQATGFSKAPTAALRGFGMVLKPGVRDVYFTDEVGNVSTSRFRPGLRESSLELMPRYPIFGGWNYSFTVGWNIDAGRLLKTAGDDEYVLRVPFIEGPENVVYDEVVFSAVLPEGAEVIELAAPVNFDSTETTVLKSHLDTKGRTVVRLTAHNVIDEDRRRDVYILYKVPASAQLQKPAIVAAALGLVFAAVMFVQRVDTSISK